jgi:hypothetical protein
VPIRRRPRRCGRFRFDGNKTLRALAALPKAADLYRRQLAEGLDGDPREALKARVFLRDWFSGKIWLEPLADGGLKAHWNENATALLRAADRVVAGAGFANIRRRRALRRAA